MKKIALNISNYSKCLCPVCPVQVKSGPCAPLGDKRWVDERKTVGDILEDYAEHPETYEMEMADLEKDKVGSAHGFRKPETAEMKELYCVVGKSSCKELALGEPCQCPDCLVWQNGGLDAVYYCREGRTDGDQPI